MTSAALSLNFPSFVTAFLMVKSPKRAHFVDERARLCLFKNMPMTKDGSVPMPRDYLLPTSQFAALTHYISGWMIQVLSHFM